MFCSCTGEGFIFDMKNKNTLKIDNKQEKIFKLAVIASSHCFGVSEDDILVSRSRHELLAKARQVANWLTRKSTPLSYNQIGNLFGRDHGTIMHGYRAVGLMLEQGKSHKYYGEAREAIDMFKFMVKQLVKDRKQNTMDVAKERVKEVSLND